MAFIKKHYFILIFVVVTVVGIVFITGYYWSHFKTKPISESTELWGSFGDYIGGILNPFLTLANIVIFIFISFRLIKYEDKHLSPKLIFAKYKNETHYLISNVGHGPALNIVVAFRKNDTDDWQDPYLVFSLKSGENVELTMDYAKGQHEFGAKYNDIFDNTFTITCKGDQTSIPKSGDHLKKWSLEEISRLWQLEQKNGS